VLGGQAERDLMIDWNLADQRLGKAPMTEKRHQKMRLAVIEQAERRTGTGSDGEV
jgi:hypothetical protein